MELQGHHSEELNVQLHSLLDFLPVGIGVNIGGTLVYANPYLVKVLGFDEMDNLVGTRMLNYVHPDYREIAIERTQQVKATGSPVGEIEEQFIRNNGESFVASVTSEPFVFNQQDAVLVVIQDITDRKNQQKNTEQTQRLESMGLMAGGIAHDFNNLLTVIVGNAVMMRKSLSNDLCLEHLDAIEETSKQAAGLCQQMLIYSGKGTPELEVVNLSELTQSLIKLLKVSIHKNVQLHCDFVNDESLIQCDIAQVQQVILNLVLNANDAIGDKSGQIDIRTGVQRLDTANMDTSFYKKSFISGDYVFVEVRDTGCGMDEKTQQHIFDPFFTTKFTGRGLGMSATLGIIYGHNGAIKVVSTLSKGTCIHIYFPISKAQSSVASEAQKELSTITNTTILIVDDEPSILKVTTMVLEDAGYQVIQAVDGLDAVEKYKQHQAMIDVVLLDMTMPRMSGKDALKAMKNVSQEVRVLIASGYNAESVSSLTSDEDSVGFIQKPYRPRNLLAELDKLMNA